MSPSRASDPEPLRRTSRSAALRSEQGRGWGHAAPALAAALGLAAALAGCGSDPEVVKPPDTPAPPDKTIPYDTLSEYGFFEGALVDQRPAPGVLPYQVASPLWADQAGKGRYIVLPKGEHITISGDEDWAFPLGSTIIKTFFYALDQREPDGAARILETRLLVLNDEGWQPYTYVWNDEQTEATRVVAGERLEIDYTKADGTPGHEQYLVPNKNQCNSCHERDDVTHVLGLITPQLNRDVDVDGAVKNQLSWLVEQGAIDASLPAPEGLSAFPDPHGAAPLDTRARAYLHANCSHCHRPGGGGGPSGLVLLAWEMEPLKNGICKGSAAAGAGTGGHSYDIVPGAPEESIVIFRMSSTDPEIKMPELPNRIPDEAGVALISEWIGAMPAQPCD